MTSPNDNNPSKYFIHLNRTFDSITSSEKHPILFAPSAHPLPFSTTEPEAQITTLDDLEKNYRTRQGFADALDTLQVDFEIYKGVWKASNRGLDYLREIFNKLPAFKHVICFVVEQPEFTLQEPDHVLELERM